VGERNGAYRVLVGKPERKKPLGKSTRRWEDNIKMEVQDVGWRHGLHKWRAVVNAAVNLRVP
jgi:hypothetical protein